MPNRISCFTSSSPDAEYRALLTEIVECRHSEQLSDVAQEMLEKAALQLRVFASESRSAICRRKSTEVYDVHEAEEIFLEHPKTWIPHRDGSLTWITREYGSVFGMAGKDVKPLKILLVAKLQQALQDLRQLHCQCCYVEVGRQSSVAEVDMQETLRVCNSELPAIGMHSSADLESERLERINIISRRLAEGYEKLSTLSGDWTSLRYFRNEDNTECPDRLLGVLTKNVEDPFEKTFPDWRQLPNWFLAAKQQGKAYQQRDVKSQDIAIALAHDTSADNPTRKALFDNMEVNHCVTVDSLVYRALIDPEKWRAFLELNDKQGFQQFVGEAKAVYVIGGTRSVIDPFYDSDLGVERREYCFAVQTRAVKVVQSDTRTDYYLREQKEGIGTVIVPGQPESKPTEKEKDYAKSKAKQEEEKEKQKAEELAPSNQGAETVKKPCENCGHTNH
ncbi:hypothetical protein LTR97_012691 [Elasticomyces elasticus]|uniref:Uncharacterized protein n=1 Tax=Elasticomyces elasticus TaxID=574655 RepID=A0AAN7VWC8_9PEZI|nr:hypothetical protein LTR97_012691 [Elasticomyces elasticus]